jgi:ubiquinone biosynthesis protein COQ4
MLGEFRKFGLTNPWATVQAVRNFALTVWDPTRSDVKRGVNTLVYGALRKASPERIESIRREAPALVELFEEAYDPELDVTRLERLPDGTLGREYARFIRENQIDPLGDLLALPRPKNLLEYQFWRAYKLHDVLHVVLGCDATVLGEVPIVAYSLGQARATGVRAPALALVVLLLHMALRKPEQVQPAIRLAAEWMRRGEETEAYATHRLEDWMDQPVEAVRARVLARAA